MYHLATLLGLFPAQFVAVYVGSTLRSMQDVLENRHIGPATYVFVIAQVNNDFNHILSTKKSAYVTSFTINKYTR